MDILRLEKLGEHRAVDRFLLYALNGLIPEQQREEDYYRLTRPGLWTQVEEYQPPELDLSRRFEKSPLEDRRVHGEEFVPTMEPVPVEALETSSGFISPSGKCYSIGQTNHDAWAMEQFRERGGFTNSGRSYKAALQLQGWIACRPGYFMTLGEHGDTHVGPLPQELTRPQKNIIKFLYQRFNEKKRHLFSQVNGALLEMVGAI